MSFALLETTLSSSLQGASTRATQSATPNLEWSNGGRAMQGCPDGSVIR
jgi:hypothetical protein